MSGMSLTDRTETGILSCNLTTPELMERKATVISSLRSIITRSQELSDGFLFSIPMTPENIRLVLTFVETERHCCTFFSFHIAILSGSDELGLSITGPEGTRDFIRDEIGL